MHHHSFKEDQNKTYQHLIVFIHNIKTEFPHVANALNFEGIRSTIRRTDEEHHLDMTIHRGDLQKVVSIIEKRILNNLPLEKRNVSHKYNSFRAVNVIENFFNESVTKSEIEYLKKRFEHYTPEVLAELPKEIPSAH